MVPARRATPPLLPKAARHPALRGLLIGMLRAVPRALFGTHGQQHDAAVIVNTP